MAKKNLTMEQARQLRDAYELCIYKALRASGATKEQAEKIIAGYFGAQTLVEKYAKAAAKKPVAKVSAKADGKEVK